MSVLEKVVSHEWQARRCDDLVRPQHREEESKDLRDCSFTVSANTQTRLLNMTSSE